MIFCLFPQLTPPVRAAETVSENNLQGKVISVLGDSISTFEGYIPVADGFNLEHLARYPQDDLLTDVYETWWMQVITQLDAKLGINDSWRGATVSGAAPVTSGTTGENAAMCNLTRIQNPGANGTPDVILFYGGTNDLAHVSKVGSFDPDTAPETVDLTTQKWDNLADGYVHTLLRLRHYYPDAQIIALLPTYTKTYYSSDKLAQANTLLAQICDHYGVTYTDLRYCGISTADLPDGIHPDAAGMDYITDAVVTALRETCDVEAGENIVHSVTHQLQGAESSLSYYKGVSHGKPFVTTITGEELTVTVTMGGVDITDSVYANGTVSIANVTGDLFISAKGRVKTVYEDHLQPLPEILCAQTNLWTALEHDPQYYTVSGWGVHATGNVSSVTFPVNAGDRIYATSFGAAGQNGGSLNGIRTTWFDENGLLVSVSADKVYEEFSANGFLTAPEGAVAVCVPMWTVSDSNELFLLSCGHCYDNSVCTACGDIRVEWETGTIAAASGSNTANTTRLRTVGYLRLSDFSGVSIDPGYQLTWLAYDEAKAYIGNGTATFTGNWQKSGETVYTEAIQATYADAVYFRLALKSVSGSALTLSDAAASGVTFYASGEALPEPQYELEHEDIASIGSWQDGAIWDGKLFVLNGSGSGAVYALDTLRKLSAFSLDHGDVLKPHANSVCFGSTYYAPEDRYPLLYVNIYNNYASAEDRREGTCCVYRITESNGAFSTKLVQVIQIGFTEDLTLWKSLENNGDVRPYGNFLVDTDQNKLYAYVMRDAEKTTRFFCFDLPELTAGVYNEEYGCPVVTLESGDIENQFDTAYFRYLQGATYTNGLIVSAEGFASGGSAEPVIRILDLETGAVQKTYYLARSGLTAEPEAVCVDPDSGLLYYAAADGVLRILTIPEVAERTSRFNITSSNIVLGNELAMYFYVRKTDLEGTDYVAVITKTYADGREDLVVEIPFERWEETTDGRMRFRFDGIAAKEMGDPIRVVVKKADGHIATNTYVDSIKDYVERGFKTGKITSQELGTMLVDMLNYGTAAQGLFAYDPENPINGGISDWQEQYATKTAVYENIQEKGNGYRAMTLTLESNISATFLFNKESVTTDMTAVVTFTDHYGKDHAAEIPGSEFTDRGAAWGILLDELVVADGACPITCVFKDADGNPVEGVYGIDSMESMCARAIAGGGGDYYAYIVNFCDSAYAFFH